MKRQESVVTEGGQSKLNVDPIDQDDCWKVIDSYFK